MYLKESHRLLSKKLSGKPEMCHTFPRVGTFEGMPLIIPRYLRKEILSNNVRVIKAVSSILSLYRVIKCPPILRLNTITDPFKGLTQVLPEYELASVAAKLGIKKYRLGQYGKLLTMTSAGPNVPVSALGAPSDAIAFSKNPHLLEAFRVVTNRTGKSLYDLLIKDIEYSHQWLSGLPSSFNSFLDRICLGRLSKKDEAAGKVRIFAITDIWTQSALFPLHDALFNILNDIKQDGTFDQHKPLKDLLNRGISDLYSFDLSAATDRLPIELQTQILSL